MNVKKVKIGPLSVIGKERSSTDGKDFVKSAWADANEHFSEVYPMAIKDKQGRIRNTWGLMSDFSRKLMPWEDHFSKGIYLAGVEVNSEAEAPVGWCKWDVPEREYLAIEVENGDYKSAFNHMIYYYIDYARHEMIGAAFDYTDLQEKKDYIYFPVRKKVIVLHDEPMIEKISRCGMHCGYCFFDKCGGCDSGNDFCSFATIQPDKKCPNVTCSKEKGVKGCYECDELDICKNGFFTDDNIAHVSCLFIKKEGLLAYENSYKNMLKYEAKDLLEYADDEERMRALYEFLNK